MGKHLSLVLTALSSVAVGYSHSLSHGKFHGSNHHTGSHVGTRSADSSSVDFAGVTMFPNGTLSGMGLSDACENALYGTVNCDDSISSLITDDYIGSLEDTTTTALLCAASCESSIAELYDSVSTSCGDSAELTPGISYLSLINELWSNWNQSCFVDPTSGQNCNDEIASFDNVTSVTNISTTDLCSYCYVKKLEMMQESAYSSAYDENWQTTYEYVAATCNLTVTDFNATTSAFNVSVPTTAATCLSGNMYTTQNGDTCDSIALAQGVSAATMYYINPNILNCSDIITGTSLCLPLTCTDIYSVEANDTCTTIAVGNYIASADVMNWNSQLNGNCSNLVSPDPYWGSVLCVSPPGGTYTGQALNTSSSPSTPSPVSPPAGVTVANGTTLDCGAWFVNEASLGYNCSSICLANEIAIHLFVDANPSLNYTTCNSDLVTGDAYCVDPLSGWEYYNSTITNTTTATAATSPAWPVQTGIAFNCDAYYEAQSGDTCESIASEFGITSAQFLAWNPAISSDCTSGLWLEEDYCVGVKTNATSTTTTSSNTSSNVATSSITVSTTTSSSASASASVTPPAPTQSGIPSDCSEYYVAQSGDTCATIETKYGISATQFLTWNPSVSSDCETGFWADEAYCVSIS